MYKGSESQFENNKTVREPINLKYTSSDSTPRNIVSNSKSDIRFRFQRP